MDAAKRARLEAAGFRVGTVSDFLGLSREENELIELRMALSGELKRHRLVLGLSQAALARRLGSSQSRVAKMEAGDPGVSLDLMIRALILTGASRSDLGRIIGANST